jgi:ribosomal protein L37AE/L43A
MEKKTKTKVADWGADKITEKYCPKCHDKLVLRTNEGAEEFICDKCKFKLKKK